MPVMVDKLWEQLLTQERELDSREGIIAVWEDGLAASEHALGRACVERDAECAQAQATSRTTALGYMPLLPAPSTPLTSS
jgi:hypothetical protein